MNEQAISGIKCTAKECKYHAPENRCVAGSIEVNNDLTNTDAMCKTFDKKEDCCK